MLIEASWIIIFGNAFKNMRNRRSYSPSHTKVNIITCFGILTSPCLYWSAKLVKQYRLISWCSLWFTVFKELSKQPKSSDMKYLSNTIFLFFVSARFCTCKICDTRKVRQLFSGKLCVDIKVHLSSTYLLF